MAGLPRDREAAARQSIDARLAAYVAAAAAAGVGAFAGSDANAVVVADNTERPITINSEVSIDFNTDGQTDFQIDHDRVNLNGNNLDYLQIDKNDINGQANPLAFDPGPDSTFQATPFTDGATARNDANNAAYVVNGPQGSYPGALTFGTAIGPVVSTFDWQETGNFQGSGKDIRANRLIDEDATQIDQQLGGQPPAGVQVPFNGPNFVGLNGEVRYLGVRMELNNSGVMNYGWIGIRIDNEADATGAVVGYGYETLPDVPILAGVPEPGAALLAGTTLLVAALRRGRRRP